MPTFGQPIEVDPDDGMPRQRWDAREGVSERGFRRWGQLPNLVTRATTIQRVGHRSGLQTEVDLEHARAVVGL